MSEKIWFHTQSNGTLFHVISDAGRASCNKGFRPRPEPSTGQPFLMDSKDVKALPYEAHFCARCIGPLAPLPGEEPVKAPEPAEIPANWLYMAKHTKGRARAYWLKKCGMA